MQVGASRKGLLVLLSILKIAGAVYLGLVVLAFLLQGRIVFPGGRLLWQTPQSVGWAYQNLTISVGRETTHAWFIPAAYGRGVVLFSHGNAGTMADRLESIKVFRDLGFDVLIYDYGGYGMSSGRASEKRCYADARAMWRYLTEERGVPPERIVLFGRSVGGAVAADLAAEAKPGAVILESTFLSGVRLGQETFPFLPVGLLLRHRFHNDRKAPKITAPILIVHSPEDEIVPFRHGKTLYELANAPKSFLEIHGGHNEGFLLSLTQYKTGLQSFLDPLFPLVPAADG